MIDETAFTVDVIDAGEVVESEPPRFHRVVDLMGSYEREFVCGCDADYYGIFCELWRESC